MLAADVAEMGLDPSPSPEVAALLRQRARRRVMALQIRAGVYDGVPLSENDAAREIAQQLLAGIPAVPAPVAVVPDVVAPAAPGGEDQYAARAATKLRKASPKAAGVLIKSLDSPNEWVALTAARGIVERTLPVSAIQDPNAGPLIVFPPGTKMAILVPGSQEDRALPPKAPAGEDGGLNGRG